MFPGGCRIEDVDLGLGEVRVPLRGGRSAAESKTFSLELGEVRVPLRRGRSACCHGRGWRAQRAGLPGHSGGPVSLLPWPRVARPENRLSRQTWLPAREAAPRRPATPACGPPQYLRKSSPEYSFRLGIHRFAREPEPPWARGGSHGGDEKTR